MAYRQMGRRSYGAAANQLGVGSWTPLSESDLVFWVDLQDASTYTVVGGTAISSLKNKATGVAMTFPVNNTPFETGGINGHPCLHPLVIGDRIETTEAAVWGMFDCPNTAKPYTLSYLVKPDSATTGVATFGVGNSTQSSQSTRVWGQRAGVSQYEYAQTLPSAATINRSTGAVNTNAVPLIWHSPGVGVKLSVNGGADDPSAPTSDPSYVPGVGPTRASLFSRPDSVPDSSAIQRFGELFAFSSDKSAAVLAQINAYLNAKWA